MLYDSSVYCRRGLAVLLFPEAFAEERGMVVTLSLSKAWETSLVQLFESLKQTSCFVSSCFCPVVRCSRLSPPPHSVQTGCRYGAKDNAFGDKCHFSCEIGHHHIGGSTQRVCQADGKWSGKAILCQGKQKYQNDNTTKPLSYTSKHLSTDEIYGLI